MFKSIFIFRTLTPIGGHPRGRGKHQQQHHQKAEATSSSGSGTTTLAGCGPGEAFTITTNPINSETEDDDDLSDFCAPSEDALGLSPQELARLQKRLKLRRILPSCITFEDLEDERMASPDLEAITRLELVDSDLADTHRGVLSRTHHKYLVMEAATFSDKLFTGTLIFCTVVGIFVLFWYQNFGKGFGLTHVESTL